MIVKTPGICGGSARIQGTRICVWHLSQCFEAIYPEEVDAYLSRSHGITIDEVKAARRYYEENTEEVLRERVENAK